MFGADDRKSVAEDTDREPEAPRDPTTTLLHIIKGTVFEVMGSSKPLQLRAGFDLTSEKAGELPPKRAVHIIDERMTDDGKTRMCVAAEGTCIAMGWITGRSADNKTNLKEVGRAVMEVTAAKALTAREDFDLTSPKVKDLPAGAHVHAIDVRQTGDGAHRIAFAMEGKDAVKGWVTAITKEGALNLNIAVAEARRHLSFSPPSSPDKEKEMLDKEESKEEDGAILPSPTKASNRRASRSFDAEADVPWSTTAPSNAPDSADEAASSEVLSLPTLDSVGQSSAEAPLSTGRKRPSLSSEAPSLPTLDTLVESSAEPSLPTSRKRASFLSDVVASTSAEAKVPALKPPEPTPQVSSDMPMTARKKAAPQPEQSAPSTIRSEPSPRSVRLEQSSTQASSSGRAEQGTSRRNVASGTTQRVQTANTTPRVQPTSATPRSPGSSARGAVPQASATPRLAPTKAHDGQLCVTAAKLKMRLLCELDSDEAGSLTPGTRVILLERRELGDGTQRTRVGREADGVPLGWVSTYAKDGKSNLETLVTSTPTSSAGSSSKVSSLSSVSALPNTSLPPNSVSSGALTARSSSKATATAGAVRAALTSEAVAATETAAKEAVAAQAAAAQAAARKGRQVPAVGPVGTSSPFHAGDSSARTSLAAPPSTPGRSAPTTPGRAPSTPGRSLPGTPRKSARGSSPFHAR